LKKKRVDLVLVVDSSESMGPCFELLKQHLNHLITSLQQADFKVRLGLLAYAAGVVGGEPVYDFTFLGGSDPRFLQELYSDEVKPDNFFSDSAKLISALGKLRAQGNEDTVIAIDTAADFPFSPLNEARRVIAVFTDEPLEAGVSEMQPMKMLPRLVEKLSNRRIQLFVAAPESNALWELGSLEGAQIETIASGNGLRNVDFRKLFEQMGKTISMSSLQSTAEEDWMRGIFGQATWGNRKTISSQNRERVLRLGEACTLNTSQPLTKINVKLQWTLGVDLDLHAFYKTRNESLGHIFFADMTARGIQLDRDAGVSRNRGQHEENLTISELDQFSEVIFATNIYSFAANIDSFATAPSYSDFDGKVVVETNNGDRIVVPLTSTESKRWCAIARITNPANRNPQVENLNRVVDFEPQIGSFD
jgi:uncharacterized protein involved in tellurium resistance